MAKYFLAEYPSPKELGKQMADTSFPAFREVNGHIHTPYSFSAFSDMDSIFEMAKEEKIAALGINDFFVTDGYPSFYKSSVSNFVFPLFNIEFIGLLKEEQKKGLRINDPTNPGRVYFTGKGLDYPFSLGFFDKMKLNAVRKESQNQIRAMIGKLNNIIKPVNPSIFLSYEDIKKRYAHDLVRERHLAKAVRSAAEEKYPDKVERLKFLETVFGGKKSKAGVENNAMLENEIRSNLLKSGGAAFVEENGKSFLELKEIIKIIIKAGGIPCYPVLLDNASGTFTEYESDWEQLHKSLENLNVRYLELIPGRNSLRILRDFVKFFHEREYLVTFGTEHNTPEMVPLTVSARGSETLDEGLKKISWESTCVVAAHQYLRAQGMQGYVMPGGAVSIKQKNELVLLGRLVIESFLSNKS